VDDKIADVYLNILITWLCLLCEYREDFGYKLPSWLGEEIIKYILCHAIGGIGTLSRIDKESPRAENIMFVISRDFTCYK